MHTSDESTLKKIEKEFYKRLSSLDKLNYDELNALNSCPIKETINIDGKTFEFSSWSELAVDQPDDVIAVIVDTWKNNFIFSVHYMKGFLFGKNGYIRELDENELLEYD